MKILIKLLTVVFLSFLVFLGCKSTAATTSTTTQAVDKPLAKADLTALGTFHKNEDIEGMLKMASETEGMTAEFSDLLLDNRNKNWIPEITRLAKEKPSFFGVGALHLPGENGVIKLLRKAGFSVTPVN